ncbi:hypothetical protein [Brumimicrobium mesophilum]|uniref:hypothetical protein n=1 Tax=Brumimicrobium mesophilum TaxID=392717 RepID=UPI000D1445C7|nr:hypothetical protein [Brumimicrobium mesophilum]
MKVRDEIRLTCGAIDSVTVLSNQTFLDSVIQLEITNGKQKLLHDIGIVYYAKYLKWKNHTDIIKSIDYFTQGWKNYQDRNCLWDLGRCYGILDDCSKKLRLTELYVDERVKASEMEFIDYQQIYIRYKNCLNKS